VAAGWSGGFVSLLALLLIAGLGSGVQHPLSSSLVSRAYEDGPRRAALGTYNFAGDLGKVTVPAAVALLTAFIGWRTAGAAYGIIGLGAALAIMVGLAPFGRADRATLDASQDHASPATSWGIRDARAFQALAAVGMIDNATRTGLLTFLPFALIAKGLTVAGLGGALAVVFAGGALGKFVCGLVAERVGVVRTVILTEACTAAGILTVVAAPLPLALGMLFPLGIALNGTSSVLYGTVADLVSPERRARAYGLFYTLSIGASALAPSLYGALADMLGVPATLGVVALVVLVTVPLSLILRPAIAVTTRA
jgi:MFS family permease